jgi:hypothetical protein
MLDEKNLCSLSSAIGTIRAGMKTFRMRSTTTTRCWNFPSLVSGLKGGELQGVASAVPCSPRVPHSPDHSPR